MVGDVFHLVKTLFQLLLHQDVHDHSSHQSGEHNLNGLCILVSWNGALLVDEKAEQQLKDKHADHLSEQRLSVLDSLKFELSDVFPVFSHLIVIGILLYFLGNCRRLSAGVDEFIFHCGCKEH